MSNSLEVQGHRRTDGGVKGGAAVGGLAGREGSSRVTSAGHDGADQDQSGGLKRAVGAVIGSIISGVAGFNRWRLPARKSPHPLLTGVHQPMTEELTLLNLAVEGEIPQALDGRYVRIGPNPVAADPRSYHFFTGDGMLHGVRIKDGAVLWYRNRWIRSNAVAKARDVPPAPGPRHVFDTVNTSVLDHAGAGWALVEAGSTPVRFDAHLEDQRYDDFGGTLPGSFTAHPRRDDATGELHALCYEATDPSLVRYNVVDPQGVVRRSVAIPVEHGPLIHDCAITDRYIIILDLPLTLSMRVVLAGHGFPYRWNEKHSARIGLLPREGEADAIIWLPIDPCFVFHTANAYDLPDGRLILDVVAYSRMFAGDNQGPDEQPRGLERWTIDPVSGAVEQRTLDPSPQELPTIDARRTGRPYRFVYALGLPQDMTETLVGEAPLIKHDLEQGTRQIHTFGPGRVAGEFVFVPRSSLTQEGVLAQENALAQETALQEDDGWLIGLVIEQDGCTTALEILSARDVSAPPIATVRIPHRIPPGIHGAWFDDRARDRLNF